MIYDFVDKILVHAPQKVNGERHMRIEVVLRFIGNFQVAQPEPPKEDPAVAEAKRKRREADRKRYARHKEKLAAEKQLGEEEAQHAAVEEGEMDCAV